MHQHHMASSSWAVEPRTIAGQNGAGQRIARAMSLGNEEVRIAKDGHIV